MNEATGFDSFHLIVACPLNHAIEDGMVIPVSAVAEAEPDADAVPPLHEIGSMDGDLRSLDRLLAKKAITPLSGLHQPKHHPMPDLDDRLREPFPCQKDVIAASVKILETVGSGFIVGELGTGTGGLPSTKVLTQKGWTTLGQIQVGEEIIDPAGGMTTVTGVFRRGAMPMFRVTFADGASTVCSRDHLWLVNTPSRKWKGQPGRVLTLDSIAEKGLSHANGNLQHFIPLVAPVDHPEADLLLDPYLLGVLLGDGGLTSGTPRLTTADDEIRASVSALLPEGITPKLLAGSSIDYSLSQENRDKDANALTLALRVLGLHGLGSSEKFVPDEYLFASARQRLALLQGLLDTDGSLDASNGVGIDFSSTSRRLAEDVRAFAQSLGGTASPATEKETACRYKGEIVRGKTYRTYIALPSGVRPFRLSRKLAGFRDRCKYEPTRAIRSMEPIGDHECICISVASATKLCVTDDYIVTHTMHLGRFAVFKHAQKPRRKGGKGDNIRCIVLCPDHLISQWKREIEETIPGAIVHHCGPLNEEESKEPRRQSNGRGESLAMRRKTGSQNPALADVIRLLDNCREGRWDKSMAEKIDQADMQRSWPKVKSSGKRRAKKPAEANAIDGEPGPKPEKPNSRVHLPEPDPTPATNKVYAVIDDVVFDDDLLAKMMANLAANGMTTQDIFG